MRPFWHQVFGRLQADGAPAFPCGDDAAAGAGGNFTREAPTYGLLPLLKIVTTPLAAVYGLGARTRRGLYRRGILRARRLPAPVVSIGNLTVGGAGKTPVTAAVARLCQRRGQRVAILSRGYGGRASGVVRLADGARLYHQPPEVGEEAYLLARSLPGVAVYTGASRLAAGMAAWRDLRPDLFLLDDGFQHFQLHRDLDLVLLDAAAPFGNGCLLPRGPLREPVATLANAQAIILTRYDEARHRHTRDALERAFPEKLLLTAAVAPVRVRSFPGGHGEPPAALGNRLLFAFAGLARPGVFAHTLTELGVDLKGFAVFPDHYPYTRQDLLALARRARTQGAGALVTTAKDWARLGERWEGDLLLWVLEVEAQLEQPEKLLSCLAELG